MKGQSDDPSFPKYPEEQSFFVDYNLLMISQLTEQIPRTPQFLGWEAPWNMGEFYGQSYLVDPRGQMVAVGSRDKDEVVIGDMDRRVIEEVRNTWQFYRDRRPETYGEMVEI